MSSATCNSEGVFHLGEIEDPLKEQRKAVVVNGGGERGRTCESNEQWGFTTEAV